MNRLGLGLADVQGLAEGGGLHGLEVELVMSHLACAEDARDPMNAAQADRFAHACALFPGVPTSLSATHGMGLGERFRADVVRPGIGLYGAGAGSGLRLQTVAAFDAPVLQVRHVAAGESIGYGAAFRAPRPMQVAIACAGYGDGVLRAVERPRYGWFAGAKRRLLGRISMDLIALDVTGCDAHPGARVELFGPNLTLDEAAADAGTIPYELLTAVSPRVHRVYLGAGDAA